ncbi:uncharacterized protein LOC110246758 [Exaiptasia diaphana]|uniref:Uncharacterized protein n=1 Tax=Exaiptasia diaphana TaxID=2652724 RepID=A0A913XQU6_EXADI|nr:uncharacterized protein LOC110246758 [Exaiptasia diaphana]KXJ24980.1 hypothetical protein AC249_AIPGENE13866 [Exaiptasia diaphana]
MKLKNKDNSRPVQRGKQDEREQQKEQDVESPNQIVPANFDESGSPEEPGKFSGVFKQVLRALDILQSLCKLQLTLKYQKWRVVVVKTAKLGKVIGCKITCDLHKGKLRLKLETSALVTVISSLIPAPIQTAVTSINTAFKRIPSGNAVIVSQLSEKILHFIAKAKSSTKAISCPSIPNAIGSKIADDNPVVSLVDSLLSLNVVFILGESTAIKLKRKQILGFAQTGDVEIDLRHGIEIVKRPRNLFRREHISLALLKLTEWTSSERELKMTIEIIEILKYVKNFQSH